MRSSVYVKIADRALTNPCPFCKAAPNAPCIGRDGPRSRLHPSRLRLTRDAEDRASREFYDRQQAERVQAVLDDRDYRQPDRNDPSDDGHEASNITAWRWYRIRDWPGSPLPPRNLWPEPVKWQMQAMIGGEGFITDSDGPYWFMDLVTALVEELPSGRFRWSVSYVGPGDCEMVHDRSYAVSLLRAQRAAEASLRDLHEALSGNG